MHTQEIRKKISIIHTQCISIQRCLDMNKEIKICYVDLENTFDKLRHDKFIDILKTELNNKDLHRIINIY